MRDVLLRKVSGYEFYNTSKYTFEKLLDDPDNIEENFHDYLESDLLEAIVALPNDIFYNTGIATYIWVLSNKKAGLWGFSGNGNQQNF